MALQLHRRQTGYYSHVCSCAVSNESRVAGRRKSALLLRRGGRSGMGRSREHFGAGLPVTLVPEERRRSLGLPVLHECSQVRSSTP
jgi:hypothetical protein